MKTRLSGFLRRSKFPGWAVLVAACAVMPLRAQTPDSAVPVSQAPPQVSQQVIVNAVSETDTNVFTTLTNISEINIPSSLTNLSPGMLEIIKLAQANVGEAMMVTFITNSFFAFAPTADEIVYLNDLGVSEKVIQALYEHGSKVRATMPLAGVTNQVQIVQSNAPDTNQVFSNVITPTSPVVSTDSQQVVYASPPAEPVTTTQFYSALAPYGTWMTVPEYGYVWQPTVVTYVPTWSPYADHGRWINSSYGWYWHSDYSWGWAPFHYGRWHRHAHRGWLWVPGHVWSPAWVSWRYSDNYCGWAPLPPEAHYSVGIGFTYYGSRVGSSFGFGLSHQHYTFVPTDRFHHRHVYRHRLPHDRIPDVYHRTAVHNNYHSGPNNIVYNHGIPVARVSRAAGTEIPRVNVHAYPRPNGAPRERLAPGGDSLYVYRPVTERTEARSGLRSVTGRSENNLYGRPTMPGGTLGNQRQATTRSPQPGISRPTPTWVPRTAEAPRSTGVPVYTKPPEVASVPRTPLQDPSRTLRTGNSAINRNITTTAPQIRNTAPAATEASRTAPSQSVSPAFRPSRTYTPAPQAPAGLNQRPSRNAQVFTPSAPIQNNVQAAPAPTQPTPAAPAYQPPQSGRIISRQAPAQNYSVQTPPSGNAAFAPRPNLPPRITTPAPSYTPPTASPAPVTPYSPPARSYSPPANNYSPPARTYSPPANNYTPPARNYSPPANNYSPPARSYSPPAPTPTPPVRSFAPSPRPTAPSQDAPSRGLRPGNR